MHHKISSLLIVAVCMIILFIKFYTVEINYEDDPSSKLVVVDELVLNNYASSEDDLSIVTVIAFDENGYIGQGFYKWFIKVLWMFSIPLLMFGAFRLYASKKR